MKVKDVISLRLLTPELTDWELKDQLTALRAYPDLAEVVVLPSYLRRAKQLLAGTQIEVGSVVDYPLGAGTVGKIAFEVGHCFQDGADFLELAITSETILREDGFMEQLQKAIVPLAFAWGEIRFQLDFSQTPEMTKIRTARKIPQLDWSTLVLREKDFADAQHDATTFEYETRKQTIIMSLNEASVADIQELIFRGVKKVGLATIKDLDLLAEIQPPTVEN